MDRWWVVVMFLYAGCSKKAEPAFECYANVKGGVEGAVLKLGDEELGILQEPSGGYSGVSCSVSGLTHDQAMKKFQAAKAVLVFATPCGPKELELENTTKNRIDVVVPTSAKMPDGVRVYSDATIETVKIGSSMLHADVRQRVEGPDGAHVGWIFDATCMPKTTVEVGGKVTGELDVSRLATPAPLGNSVFIPSDPAKCYEHDDVGYGEVTAGSSPEKLQNAAGYVLERDSIEYLMRDAPRSVAVRQGDKMKYLTYLKACP